MKKSTNSPDYKRIFNDIISMNYPDKRIECQNILSRPILSFLDIIELDRKIFAAANKDNLMFNQRHRSYSKQAISDILAYQEKNKLNNTQLAIHFKLSRNSIAKWKKCFSAKQFS